jgi:urease accessory protein
VCPTIATTTRTDAALAVERGGIVRELRRGARLAIRVLARGEPVRAALVPIQAGPLAGDHDAVRLRVGAGATLALEPIAATLALPGAGRTVLELDVEVAASGRVVLDEPPLIVAEGADVVRVTRLRLAAGAVAALRDLVILGRAGEGPGRLEATTRVTLAGAVLLHETLRIDPATWAGDAYVALAPGHRAIGTVALLGARGDGGQLAGPGSLWRASGGGSADVEAALAGVWAAVSGPLVHPF